MMFGVEYGICTECKCRRPPTALSNGVCNDNWHEKLDALTNAPRQKKKRP